MAAKKKAAPPPPPAKKKGFKLTTSAEQADEALQVLNKYVTERFELATDKNRLGDLTTAIQLMNVMQLFADKVGDMVKSPAEKAYNALRFSIVPDFMSDAEITTLTVEGVGRVNLADDISLSVEDKEKMTNWLTENDLEDMIQRTVNTQTLTAFVRRRIKAGETTPDGVKITPVTRASITR